MAVRIVTDSTSDLAPALAQELGVNDCSRQRNY